MILCECLATTIILLLLLPVTNPRDHHHPKLYSIIYIYSPSSCFPINRQESQAGVEERPRRAKVHVPSDYIFLHNFPKDYLCHHVHYRVSPARRLETLSTHYIFYLLEVALTREVGRMHKGRRRTLQFIEPVPGYALHAYIEAT